MAIILCLAIQHREHCNELDYFTTINASSIVIGNSLRVETAEPDEGTATNGQLYP